MCFNKQLTESEWSKVNTSISIIELPLNRWIDKKDMSKKEKDEVRGWSEMGGYLKTLGYEEAWKVWWEEAKEEQKNAILNCGYFDAKIFEGITGIKDAAIKSLKGKKVKINFEGCDYEAIIQ